MFVNKAEMGLLVRQKLLRHNQVVEQGDLGKRFLGHGVCIIVLIHRAHLR